MIRTFIDAGVLIYAARSQAVSVGATEFITNEKPEKSIHRTQSIKIISIHPSSNNGK
jgi:hypothetical protein